jgi:hypothetical protein
MLEAIRAQYPSASDFAAALKEAGITEEKLRDGLSEQSRMLRFIDFRFRPAVTVSEEEVRTYYETEYGALWVVLHPGIPVPSLDEARDEVDRLLIDRKVDAQMDEWLQQAREQTRVVYREEAFQ